MRHALLIPAANFKPGFHHCGSYVNIALLKPSGEVQD